MRELKWYLDTAVALELKADEGNDAMDHDELHAASVVAYWLAGHSLTTRQSEYIDRWLEGLK